MNPLQAGADLEASVELYRVEVKHKALPWLVPMDKSFKISTSR